MIDHTLFVESMLFGKLTEKELEAIVKASAKRDLLRGDVLFHENDKPNSLFLVESGRIAIVNKSFIGKESVVALMENGDLFGEMGLFDNRGRSAEARALEDSCVIEVTFEPIKKLLISQNWYLTHKKSF